MTYVLKYTKNGRSEELNLSSETFDCRTRPRMFGMTTQVEDVFEEIPSLGKRVQKMTDEEQRCVNSHWNRNTMLTIPRQIE